MKRVLMALFVITSLAGIAAAGHDGCHQRQGWESKDNGPCNSNHINDSISDQEPTLAKYNATREPAILGIDNRLRVEQDGDLSRRYLTNNTEISYKPTGTINSLLATDDAIWFASQTDVVRLDRDTSTVEKRFEIDFPNDLTLVGTDHLVFSGDKTLYLVRESTNSISKKTTLNQTIESVAAVGTDVYIGTEGNLTKWDPENNTIEWRREHPAAFSPRNTVVRSNGDLVVTSGDNGMFIYYPNGTEKGNITFDVGSWRQSSITNKYIVGGNYDSNSWEVYSLDNLSLVSSFTPSGSGTSSVSVVGDDRAILAGDEDVNMYYVTFPGLDPIWNKSLDSNFVGSPQMFVYKEKLILGTADDFYYTGGTFNSSAQSDQTRSYDSLPTPTPTPTPTATPEPTPTPTSSPTSSPTAVPAGDPQDGSFPLIPVGVGALGLGVVGYVLFRSRGDEWI